MIFLLLGEQGITQIKFKWQPNSFIIKIIWLLGVSMRFQLFYFFLHISLYGCLHLINL